MAEMEQLGSFEEFRASLAYFFCLFRRPFPPELEQAARNQWAALGPGAAVVCEDGGNNPLVELRLAPEFGRALCAALGGEDGLPVLAVPCTDAQLAFWRSRAVSRGLSSPSWLPAEDAAALAELSESTSHLETLREVIAWYAGGQPPGSALRVYILGAAARYEYGASLHRSKSPAQLADTLSTQLAQVVAAAAPGAPSVEFRLCGRDVPAELSGRVDVPGGGGVSVRHFTGYLHDLPEAEGGVGLLRNSLVVALHSGLGLEHPELSFSWPPTLQRLAAAAPLWLAVSSFNAVEHAAAERALKAAAPGQLHSDLSGPNPAASLSGPDAIGPFDGLQGKRNYCLLCARLTPVERSAEGWDLFA